MKTVTYLGEDQIAFEHISTKKEFIQHINDLLPTGYNKKSYVWEDEETTIVLKYADGSERNICLWDTVGNLHLDKIVGGFVDGGYGFTFYGHCELKHEVDGNFETYLIELATGNFYIPAEVAVLEVATAEALESKEIEVDDKELVLSNEETAKEITNYFYRVGTELSPQALNCIIKLGETKLRMLWEDKYVNFLKGGDNIASNY